MRQNFIERISETVGFFSAGKRRATYLSKHATHSSTNRRIFTCKAKSITNTIAFLLKIKWNLHFTFVHGLPMSSRLATIFFKENPTNSQSPYVHYMGQAHVSCFVHFQHNECAVSFCDS